MNKNKILGIAICIGIFAMMLPMASAGATVVRQGAIWNDGTLYGTVATPTDLPDNAPADSLDKLYNFDNSGLKGQRSVSEAAMGDTDYNGGRWMVFAVIFTDAGKIIHDPDGNGIVNFELKSDQEVLHHKDLGHIIISREPVKRFVCPLLKLK
jgi:hypothetical protein